MAAVRAGEGELAVGDGEGETAAQDGEGETSARDGSGAGLRPFCDYVGLWPCVGGVVWEGVKHNYYSNLLLFKLIELIICLGTKSYPQPL